MPVVRGREFGLAPYVPNIQSGEQIGLGPTGSPFTMYTFAAAGRLWAATVSYSMGSSGGAGSNQGYARVRIEGGATLAIVECCVVSFPAADSNTDALTYHGIAVASGTKILLDVNNAATIAGVVQRGSGLVIVSIP